MAVSLSMLIIWMSPFLVVGVSGGCFNFTVFPIQIHVSKQCRPWWDAAFCGSALLNLHMPRWWVCSLERVKFLKLGFRALDKREYFLIISDSFCKFCLKTYVVTRHLNRLEETVQMRGHNVWFYAELTKITSSTPSYLELCRIWWFFFLLLHKNICCAHHEDGWIDGYITCSFMSFSTVIQ